MMTAREALLTFLSRGGMREGEDYLRINRPDGKSAIRVRYLGDTMLYRFDSDGALLIPYRGDYGSDAREPA